MAKFTNNPNIHSFNELAYFKNLTSLDLHGDSNLAGSFDLKQHTKLTSVNVKNTKVAGLTFAEGAIIASIDYSPETTSIVLKSLSALTSVSADGAAKVVTLDIENCPNVDSIAVLKEVISSPLTNVTLIGVNGTEVADAADVIYSLICKSGTHNLQGNIVVASVYNFLPDLINATTATSGVACIPSSGTSEAAFVIKYNGTTEPTVEAIGLSINESAASYNEGSVPSSIPNSVSANSTIFKNVNWTTDDGSIDTNGNLALSNAVAENNDTETDTSVVTATSIYNSAAKATRNVSVVRVGMSSITLSLDGDAPAAKDDVFTLQLVKDADTTKPFSHVEFEISDTSLVEQVDSVDANGKATFKVISEDSGTITISAKNKYDASVVSSELSWVVNDLVIVNALRTDSEEMAANDRAIMDVAYAQGWSASQDVMTKTEAGAVNNIGTVFRGNESIVNFDAFEHFNDSVVIEAGGYSDLGAFGNCTGLKHIKIPSNAIFRSTKGNPMLRTFEGCSSLESIDIPITAVFEKQTNWDNAGSKSIFKGCSSLKTFSVPSIIFTLPYSFCDCSSIETVTIPTDITKLGGGLFNGCTSLKISSLPSNIGGELVGTFGGCKQIETMDLSNTSITGLGGSTFINCSKLRLLKLGSNCSIFRTSCIQSCTSLDKIVSYYEGVISVNGNPSWGAKAFVLYVPDSVIDDYAADSYWSGTYSAGRIKPISEYTE